MWPKIVQVNKSDVYIIAGNDTTPDSQNTRFQCSRTSVYKFDLATCKVTQKSDLNVGRQAFGICSLGNHILVAGGGSASGNLDSCELYDIERDQWQVLDEAKLPYTCFAMNLLTVHKRYVFGFGMMTRDIVQETQDFLRLDTWNISKGWEIIPIKSELPKIGCQYGFFPLEVSQ